MSRQRKWNRLEKESIEVVMVIKSRLITKDTVCCKYIPRDNQIKIQNSEILYLGHPPPGHEYEFESEGEVGQ